MRQFFALVLLAALFGCETSSRAVLSWPVEAYPYGCEGAESIRGVYLMLDSAPVCATNTYLGEGFEYQDEFDACKQSMENYLSYLDRMAQCKISDTETSVSSIQDQFLAYLECRRETPDTCNADDVKKAYKEAPISQIGFWFPSIECEREHVSSIDWCSDRLADDFEKIVEAYSKDRDDFLHEVDYDADEAVRLFNCKARREKYCF